MSDSLIHIPGDISPELLGDVSQASLIHPDTGELIPLGDAEPQQIADWIEAVRGWEAGARTAKLFASAELHRRMDAEAKWTIHAEGLDIVGQSPDRNVYDADELMGVLQELVEEKAITRDAAQAALKREVTYKPAKRGIDALLKLGGQIRERIEACKHPDDRPRRITLRRS